MALVAYDNSDSSEYEDEDNESVVVLDKHVETENGKHKFSLLKNTDIVFIANSF